METEVSPLKCAACHRCLELATDDAGGVYGICPGCLRSMPIAELELRVFAQVIERRWEARKLG